MVEVEAGEVVLHRATALQTYPPFLLLSVYDGSTPNFTFIALGVPLRISFFHVTEPAERLALAQLFLQGLHAAMVRPEHEIRALVHLVTQMVRLDALRGAAVKADLLCPPLLPDAAALHMSPLPELFHACAAHAAGSQKPAAAPVRAKYMHRLRFPAPGTPHTICHQQMAGRVLRSKNITVT